MADGFTGFMTCPTVKKVVLCKSCQLYTCCIFWEGIRCCAALLLFEICFSPFLPFLQVFTIFYGILNSPFSHTKWHTKLNELNRPGWKRQYGPRWPRKRQDGQRWPSISSGRHPPLPFSWSTAGSPFHHAQIVNNIFGNSICIFCCFSEFWCLFQKSANS